MFRMVNTFVYYGLSLNTGLLSGNIFLNAFLSAAVEVPGMLAYYLLATYIGRKRTLVGGMLMAGITSFLCIPFLENPGNNSHVFMILHV